MKHNGLKTPPDTKDVEEKRDSTPSDCIEPVSTCIEHKEENPIDDITAKTMDITLDQ